MDNVYHLNYRGDRRSMRNHVGPDTQGNIYAPVDAEYDADTDRTRVSFERVEQGGAA